MSLGSDIGAGFHREIKMQRCRDPANARSSGLRAATSALELHGITLSLASVSV
jgi:hypothetical protein